MKTTRIIILSILGVLLIAAVVSYFLHTARVGSDIKNATYIIEGEKVTLKDGISDVALLSGSASHVVTKYFGNAVTHDFDDDGRPDTAFLITQSRGGSATFYYVVVARSVVGGVAGSSAVLLGDRIAPQTTEVGPDNTIVVNYADRKSTDSFVVPPSIGKTMRLSLDKTTHVLSAIASR